MAAMDFPAAPTVGQRYPSPVVSGLPQYEWNGETWVSVLPPDMTNYVLRAGDTMGGPLTLAGEPVNQLHAATKEYVDRLIAVVMPAAELRFTRASNQYMQRLFATKSLGAFTMSMWVKRVGLGTHQALFGVKTAGHELHVGFLPDNSLGVYGGAAGDVVIVGGMPAQTSTSLWLNIVWTSAAENPSNARFHTFRVNNNGAWAMTALVSPAGVNSNETHYIGQAAYHPDVIMKEVIFVDGFEVPQGAFGESLGGVWTPKPYVGAFGVNGFRLNFANQFTPASSNLGRDVSGNSNHWTAVNF